MSMTQQPPAPSPPSTRARLRGEWEHFSTMPPKRLLLLAIPSLLLFWINPLLPVMAYFLQRWAGSSWSWRDRWTSIRIWTKQGTWWCAVLFICTALGITHVWFFPRLVEIMQTIWHVYLPGDLSLSPLDGHAFIARTLLLLPAAPALSFLYEWIDPRTRVQLHRILTPKDIAAKKEELASASAPLPTSSASARQEPPPVTTPPPQKKKTSRTKQQRTPPSPTEHITIDSFLTPPGQPQAPTTSQPPKPGETAKDQKKPATSPHAPVKPPASGEDDIDWKNVAE